MATPFVARLRGVGWEAYVWLIYAVPFLLGSFDTRLSALETTERPNLIVESWNRNASSIGS